MPAVESGTWSGAESFSKRLARQHPARRGGLDAANGRRRTHVSTEAVTS